MNEMLMKINFSATGLKDIQKQLDKANEKALELAKSYGASEAELETTNKHFKLSSVLLARANEEAEKMTSSLEEQQQLYSQIKNINRLIQMQERAGNREKTKELKTLRTDMMVLFSSRDKELDIVYDQISAEKELASIKKREREDFESNLRKTNEYRDKFRQQGFFGGLKSVTFSNLVNDRFNRTVSRNDDIIRSSQKELWGIEDELNSGKLPQEEKVRLEAEKERLTNEIRIRQAQNASASAQQMAFNTAIAGAKKLGKVASTVFKTMGIDLKSIMGDVVSTIKEALDPNKGMASYNTGSSIFTNSAARESQMKYGLSTSSNYAFMQARSMLGLNTDEDLMYMNQSQKEVFNNIMDRYKTWYTQLESTGALVKLQEAQLEFKMFKQELSMKLLNWFANHKEAIFKILEITMNTLEFIANVVGWILDLIPGSTKASSSSLSNSDSYGSNTNSNININVNNTNNASANLNSKAELDNSLNAANANLVKSIATSLTSR